MSIKILDKLELDQANILNCVNCVFVGLFDRDSSKAHIRSILHIDSNVVNENNESLTLKVLYDYCRYILGK